VIIKTEIDGRPALVTYLNDKFEIVDQDDATLVKAIFTDDAGGAMFLTPAEPEKKPGK
jgi:hypothetical protein